MHTDIDEDIGLKVPSPDEKGEGENESHEPDWAEVYSDLLCHTSIGVFEIPEMTIPQIDAIRRRLGKNIALKVGIPGLFGGAVGSSSPPSPAPDKPPKLSEFMAFANAFNGIK